MSGVIGQFFRQFGWTAAIAVFFSLAVARLVTPMMAAYVLKAESREVVRRDGALMRAYLAFVGFTLRWRWTTLAVTIALFVFSLSLARHLPSTFMPDDDMNQSRRWNEPP